jgi:hypothetical protein
MVGSDFRAGRRGRPFRLQWRDRAGFPPASTAIGDLSYGRLLILVNHLPRLSKLLGRTNSHSCPGRLHHEMRSCVTKIRQLLIAVPPKRFCSTHGKVLPAETDDLKSWRVSMSGRCARQQSLRGNPDSSGHSMAMFPVASGRFHSGSGTIGKRH